MFAQQTEKRENRLLSKTYLHTRTLIQASGVYAERDSLHDETCDEIAHHISLHGNERCMSASINMHHTASKFDNKSNSFIVIILPSVPLVVLLVYPKSVLRAACGRVELGAWTRRLQPPCVALRTLDHRQGFPPAGASAA